MTSFRKKLIGIGVAVSLLAVPLSVGASGFTAQDMRQPELPAAHAPGNELAEPLARYGQVEMTELERIAGRRNLDAETIRFLEENLWDYDFLAQPRGGADVEDAESTGVYPAPHDVPQLRAGELNY